MEDSTWIIDFKEKTASLQCYFEHEICQGIMIYRQKDNEDDSIYQFGGFGSDGNKFNFNLNLK